jgi:hypothetical protein
MLLCPGGSQDLAQGNAAVVGRHLRGPDGLEPGLAQAPHGVFK